MPKAALAFKPRTGRAVLVMLAEEKGELRVMERAEIPLLPQGEMAPYHAAEGLESKAAHKYVKAAVARAKGLAESAVRDAAKRCSESGHELRGCAVLVGTGMPDWTTDEILAVHVRMHKAEGEMFREVLVDAARACGIALTTLPDKEAIDSAAKKLGVTRARLDSELAALGKVAGPPWGKYQKEAAAAALVVLKAQPGRSVVR
jgi:hypothetical protein